MGTLVPTVILLAVAPLQAQERLTLDEAVSRALGRGPTVAIARADSAAAAALLSQARAIPNPTATAQRTKSTPQHHLEVEQPLVFPWTRSARVSAASWGRDAAALRLDLERATVVHDVEVAYVTAAAAAARRTLSARTAQDALELVEIAARRAEAGDAAELEVSVARIAAGEAVAQSASDSLDATTALLDLQRLIGGPVDRVTVVLADSLSMSASPPLHPLSDVGAAAAKVADASPLAVSAARADVQAAAAALALARRSRLPEPSLLAGFESHDPSGGEPGTLPLFGLALSIPLFNQGGGEVGAARTGLDRARGALDLVRRESEAAAAAADLRRNAARVRVERDRALLADAERVAELSNRAYEEGAFPLASVLEARRSARDANLRYLDDVVAARVAEADYTLVTRARQVP